MSSERHEPTPGLSVLPNGTIVERYRIVSPIAAGGFGVTYQCEHVTLGRTYALKEHFPRQFAYREHVSNAVRPTDPDTFRWALDRFIDEGRSLARCHHPNVVSVADVFEANGTAYMVLGFESGTSLQQWLVALGRPPSQAELDAILVPLLDALGYVHAQGLLHRDIAPDNIVLRDDGTPCLIDFGAARQAVAERSQMMSAIVKSGFSPPEQYTRSGRAQGPWSDIYALGATLYRAVTGKVPEEATDRLIDDDHVPVRDAVADPGAYRPSFLAAIDTALQLRYADRPQTIEQWSDMLLGPDRPVGVAMQPLPAATAGAPIAASTPSAPRSLPSGAPQSLPSEVTPPAAASTPPSAPSQPPAADDRPRLGGRAAAEAGRYLSDHDAAAGPSAHADTPAPAAAPEPVASDAPEPVAPAAAPAPPVAPDAPAAGTREVSFTSLPSSPASQPARSRVPLVAGILALGAMGAVAMLQLNGGDETSAPATPPRGTSAPAPDNTATAAPITQDARLRVASAFRTQNLVNDMAGVLKRVSDGSNGKVTLTLYQSGELVPNGQLLDAVRQNIVDAGLVPASLYTDKDLVLASGGLYPGIGSNAFVRWAVRDGVALRDRVFARHGLKAILCGLTPPKGLWSRKPIRQPSSFRGLKIRALGERGQILRELGAVPVVLPYSEIYQALARSVIDSAELWSPANDARAKIYEVAKYYYYPGFDKGFSGAVDLIFATASWNKLEAGARRLITQACNLAASVHPVDDGLSALRDRKVESQDLPSELLDALQNAVNSWVTGQQNSDLTAIWSSLKAAE